MKIEVTQEDIDNGTAINPWTCPLALAIRRAWNDEVEVSVTDIVRIGSFDSGEVYLLSEEAEEFRLAFDWRKPVKPGVFHLKRVEA